MKIINNIKLFLVLMFFYSCIVIDEYYISQETNERFITFHKTDKYNLKITTRYLNENIELTLSVYNITDSLDINEMNVYLNNGSKDLYYNSIYSFDGMHVLKEKKDRFNDLSDIQKKITPNKVKTYMGYRFNFLKPEINKWKKFNTLLSVKINNNVIQKSIVLKYEKDRNFRFGFH